MGGRHRTIATGVEMWLQSWSWTSIYKGISLYLRRHLRSRGESQRRSHNPTTSCRSLQIDILIVLCQKTLPSSTQQHSYFKTVLYICKFLEKSKKSSKSCELRLDCYQHFETQAVRTSPIKHLSNSNRSPTH